MTFIRKIQAAFKLKERNVEEIGAKIKKLEELHREAKRKGLIYLTEELDNRIRHLSQINIIELFRESVITEEDVVRANCGENGGEDLSETDKIATTLEKIATTLDKINERLGENF